ncbi:MAG: carbohydrate-binding domain-containing protein, partial [Clostridia bacterium]|nr:carbohydrate-binding domain-containing protein [Clostridia bacterium]
EDVTIKINDTTKSGNVYLVLDGVTMKNSSAPCINVEAADKLIVVCSGDNTLVYTSDETDLDGAIYSADDLTVNGAGALSITSSLHGIVGRDDVKITGCSLSIDAESIGIKANDSLRIGGTASLDVESGHDGVQIANDDGDSYFYIEAGDVTIDAGYDGIDVSSEGSVSSTKVIMAGGSVTITAGGSSSNSKDDGTSQKGVKCDGDILLEGTTLNISSADDAIHSSGSVSIGEGEITLSSSDDGIHADDALAIAGGTVTILKSYEGLEAYEIDISGGAVGVTASDDGVNAAGGSDTQSTEAAPGAWGSSNGTLTISGGSLFVSAQGDGLDSNGSIYVTGGRVIIEGPTGNGNGALDYGDGAGCVASITGGTVLALGSTGMAVNFNAGTVCSALVSLSGSAGDTITVDDGSNFSHTVSKSFECAVYASASMESGNTYTISAGSSSASADFSSSLYYSTVSGMGGPGGMGAPGR